MNTRPVKGAPFATDSCGVPQKTATRTLSRSVSPSPSDPPRISIFRRHLSRSCLMTRRTSTVDSRSETTGAGITQGRVNESPGQNPYTRDESSSRTRLPPPPTRSRPSRLPADNTAGTPGPVADPDGSVRAAAIGFRPPALLQVSGAGPHGAIGDSGEPHRQELVHLARPQGSSLAGRVAGPGQSVRK